MTSYPFFLEVGHTYQTLDGKHKLTITRILLSPIGIDDGVVYINRHEFEDEDEIALSLSNIRDWFKQERWEESK